MAKNVEKHGEQQEKPKGSAINWFLLSIYIIASLFILYGIIDASGNSPFTELNDQGRYLISLGGPALLALGALVQALESDTERDKELEAIDHNHGVFDAKLDKIIKQNEALTKDVQTLKEAIDDAISEDSQKSIEPSHSPKTLEAPQQSFNPNDYYLIPKFKTIFKKKH